MSRLRLSRRKRDALRTYKCSKVMMMANIEQLPPLAGIETIEEVNS